MTAITEGIKAPQVELLDTQGNQFNLSKVLEEKDEVVLVFYKATCPVCQMTAPFLERLVNQNKELALYGVSQDDKDETESFIKEYGLSFPILLDHELKNTRAFELTNVPSIFVVKKDLLVDKSIVGFSKEDLEYIHRLTGDQNKENLFTESDEVPPFRPG